MNEEENAEDPLPSSDTLLVDNTYESMSDLKSSRMRAGSSGLRMESASSTVIVAQLVNTNSPKSPLLERDGLQSDASCGILSDRNNNNDVVMKFSPRSTKTGCFTGRRTDQDNDDQLILKDSTMTVAVIVHDPPSPTLRVDENARHQYQFEGQYLPTKAQGETASHLQSQSNSPQKLDIEEDYYLIPESSDETDGSPQRSGASKSTSDPISKNRGTPHGAIRDLKETVGTRRLPDIPSTSDELPGHLFDVGNDEMLGFTNETVYETPH